MEQHYPYIYDGMNAFEREVKRWFDFFGALIFLILSSPLFLICYIMIKREDKDGPVIYKQERIGRFGRPFTIYKFRSMVVNAEENGPELYKADGDQRLTKTGKFLRNHHLDELPQLWNVLRGDISFVGPRPERKFYIDQIMKQDCRYKYLYQIRRVSPRMPPSTMVIRIRWRRCSSVWRWTLTISSAGHGGRTSRLCSSPSPM